MRMSRAFFKIEKAELIEQRSNRSFEFIYLENWLNTKDKIAISLMLPKSKQSINLSIYSPSLTMYCLKVLINTGSVKKCIMIR